MIEIKQPNNKSDAAFRTISEVADQLKVPQHVLRFWETKFSQVKPLKRGGGRRYYRPDDVLLLKSIQTLLYDDGMAIKGVQKLFRENSVKSIIAKNTNKNNTNLNINSPNVLAQSSCKQDLIEIRKNLSKIKSQLELTL